MNTRLSELCEALAKAGARTVVHQSINGTFTAVLGTAKEDVWRRSNLGEADVEHFFRTYGRQMFPEAILP